MVWGGKQVHAWPSYRRPRTYQGHSQPLERKWDLHQWWWWDRGRADKLTVPSVSLPDGWVNLRGLSWSQIPESSPSFRKEWPICLWYQIGNISLPCGMVKRGSRMEGWADKKSYWQVFCLEGAKAIIIPSVSNRLLNRLKGMAIKL